MAVSPAPAAGVGLSLRNHWQRWGEVDKCSSSWLCFPRHIAFHFLLVSIGAVLSPPWSNMPGDQSELLLCCSSSPTTEGQCSGREGPLLLARDPSASPPGCSEALVLIALGWLLAFPTRGVWGRGVCSQMPTLHVPPESTLIYEIWVCKYAYSISRYIYSLRLCKWVCECKIIFTYVCGYCSHSLCIPKASKSPPYLDRKSVV